MEFMYKKILGNTIWDYIATLLIIITGIIIIFAVKTLVFGKLVKRAKTAPGKFSGFLADIFGKAFIPAFYFGVIYLSVQHLKTGKSLEKFLNITGIIILTILGIRFVISIIDYMVMNYWLEKTNDDVKKRNVKSLMPVTKIVVLGLGIFFLLDNLGFKVSTLLAGLGIGGVAVALAGQAVLADLFSYFSILFDRPFEIGDFIIIDTHLGTVEHIGIKTTRIRSLSGEQLVFSNSDLTNSRVRNYKRMGERRVSCKIGVVYQTKLEQLKEMPAIIKKIIENIEDTRFDRAHFSSYGDYSLIFEIVYYVYGSDYNKYMDIQQKINLALFEEFGKRKIEFAYPTQTIFMESGKAG